MNPTRKTLLKFFEAFMKRIEGGQHYACKEEVVSMAVQGQRFSEAELARIKSFLAETDMSIHEIAVRVGCSRGSIASINRRFGIRHYNGKRSSWKMGLSPGTEAARM